MSVCVSLFLLCFKMIWIVHTPVPKLLLQVWRGFSPANFISRGRSDYVGCILAEEVSLLGFSVEGTVVYSPRRS
uniref:Secreted protein n=1 Tax=Setaria viridis TaxID=4556 RepID=A0A4U6VC35_SETVI|nr:hypothetical protein SEVIR_3G226050v2 [Setaria viridis]